MYKVNFLLLLPYGIPPTYGLPMVQNTLEPYNYINIQYNLQ
jgi:hypothetical protein